MGVLDVALPPPSATDAPGRIAFGLASLLPGIAVLAAMVATQMALRFAARAIDPTAGQDTVLMRRTQRVITNTVEQVMVFAPSLLAAAAFAAASSLPMVMALGLGFAAARAAFWIGYAIHPVLRAPGMAATAAMSFGTLAWAILLAAGIA